MQPTDVVLNGAGYMLSASSYERSQDGAPDGRTGRISFRDFFGGTRRALQLERDRAWDGERVGPALGGQGVAPWGRRSGATLLTTPAAPLPSASTRIPTVICQDRVWWSRGQYLYKSGLLSSSSWATETMAYDAGSGNTIVDMALYAGDGILLTFGKGKDILWFNPTAGTASTLMAGEQGYAVCGYAGYAIWNDARPPATRRSFLRMVHGTGLDSRYLDFPIMQLVAAEAKLYAITASAIYSFTGRVREVLKDNPAYDRWASPPDTDPPQITANEWSGEWTPFFQHGVYGDSGDFQFFVGFGGRIYTWVAGGVAEWNPNGDRAGWRDTGLRGKRCLGGTAAAGYIVVAVESWEGMSELWAWDGSGWWCLARKAAAGTGNWCWPTALAGTGNLDVLVFQEGVSSIDLFRLAPRSATVNALPASGESSSITTPLIDAGERDKAKAWRKVGAVFASPDRRDNLSSVDAVSVSLQYSINGGATWTTAGSRSLTGNTLANQQIELDAEISSDIAVSRFLMLRVTWSSVLDWAPVLVGVWAEFEVLDSPARRRRWRFTVQARDQTVDRDGAALTRTGRQLIAELWSAWQTGTTLPFRDLDYDADPTERRVRIIGIAEKVAKPSDAGRWGHADVQLVLVEV